MKIKNLSYTKIDDSNIVATFDITKDDGTLLLHVQDRGFTSTASTKAEAKAEFLQSVKNIRDAEVSKRNSKLVTAIDTFIGQETDLGA